MVRSMHEMTRPHGLAHAAGAVGVTATAAGIKWITKDGIGALGRMIVGGRLGKEFDADPQRWRMFAEVLTTLGDWCAAWRFPSRPDCSFAWHDELLWACGTCLLAMSALSNLRGCSGG